MLGASSLHQYETELQVFVRVWLLATGLSEMELSEG